jgi:hypothetical protein
MLAALLLAAAPWLEISGGPMIVGHGSAAGSAGPMARIEVGMPLTERFAAEGWVAGQIANAPLHAPGDNALLSAGIGGRFRMLQLGSQSGLWAHAGGGWAPSVGTGRSGPTAFAGALVTFQPFLKRFQLGLEGDAYVVGNALGPTSSVAFALLPSLRCTF